MSLFKPLIGTTLPLLLATVFSVPVRAQQVIKVNLRSSTSQAEMLSSAPLAVADRYDNQDQRRDLRNEDQHRYDTERRDRDNNQDQRRDWRNDDQHRYDTERRDRDNRREEHNRNWIPGHWDNGFLGIGRHWVPGHYE